MKHTVAGIASALLLALAPASDAAIVTFHSALGPEAVGATGTGSVTLEYDTTAGGLRFNVSFSGLSGVTTVAHLHCCTATPFTGTAGVAVVPPTLTDFPAGASAGTYLRTFDLFSAASYSAAFLTLSGGTPGLAASRLFDNLQSGQAYFNIHTNRFPGGEIRGFPQQPVPEPAVLALLLLGLAGLRAVRMVPESRAT